ncbi:MAG: DotA/TraY family protein [Alphaproteobacteria bacterium]|nr:DotA/TraY family protein [Alphaproteobacteria bacterium]
MSATKTKFLKYTLLPGFFPRLKDLFTSGFVHISYLMAVVYSAIGLLPDNHSYLNPANRGRFGIRHVLGEAANHLVFDKKNIDKILVYFVTLSGLVLMGVQIALFSVSLFVQQDVMAQSIPDLFSVNSPYAHGGGGPEQDIAFIMLDRVFGTRGIFESCVSTSTPCADMRGDPITTISAPYPDSFQLALHKLFHFYSIGLFFVAVLIILYFFTAIVAETAATGTPFGQRTNRAWAPVRLILFFAMLAPLNMGGANEGLNGAQLVTLWTAKVGSNFATNAWGYFNENLTTGELIEGEKILASPTIPELGQYDLLNFMYLAKTCKIIEEMAAPRKYGKDMPIDAYIVTSDARTSKKLLSTTYGQAVNYVVGSGSNTTTAKQAQIVISFGHYIAPPVDPDDPSDEFTKEFTGNVNPMCGRLALKVPYDPSADLGGLQELYYDLVRSMWFDTAIRNHAHCLIKHFYVSENEPDCVLESNFANDRYTHYNNNLKTLAEQALQDARAEITSNPDLTSMLPALKAKGWAGAALWYNRIAEINGAAASALYNFPNVVKFPAVMETVRTNKLAKNQNISGQAVFNPRLESGGKISYEHEEDQKIAAVLYRAYSLWNTDSLTETTYNKRTGNIVVDGINALLGTSGIFSIRDNVDVHPLAQLSSLGRAMMQASVRNLALGAGGQNFAGLIGNIGDAEKAALQQIGGALWGLGLSVMLMSIILYYILPMLPFVYFMFAVSGWIKSIFEAMVAMPLWAMAHIRIDGEGIPGRDASNGYFLLLEIFIRPVLIVTGLLASIILFSSMVHVLNDIFTVVVENVSGFDTKKIAETGGGGDFADFLRSPVDEIFYTVLYVILVYMMALSSFKLIDLIPNQILRWSGVSVSAFQEGAGDPAGQISGQIYTGGNLLINRVKGGGALPALLN